MQWQYSKVVMKSIIKINLLLFFIMCIASCMTDNAREQHSFTETGSDSSSVSSIVDSISLDSLFRRKFRDLLKQRNALPLPYKLRMDAAMRYDTSYHCKGFDEVSRVENNEFCLVNYIIGYLPDTSRYYVLLGLSLHCENEGYILTYSKDCELISSKKISNHSSGDITEEVLIDDHYFTIDKDLKIHYYFHDKFHFLDDFLEEPSKRTEWYREECYENFGNIDSTGHIHYDYDEEVNLKHSFNYVVQDAATPLQ